MSGGFCFKPVPLLSVPIKSTTQLDWSAQIEACLEELGENPLEYKQQIVTLNILRQKVQEAPISMEGLKSLYRYYTEIEDLYLRFVSLKKPQKIVFEWCDAFDPEDKVKQSSFAFEKANLAFNMAAIITKLAASESFTQENSSKMAAWFELSASIFSWMRETFLHPPLADLYSDSLQLLKILMQAQAQECILFKAIESKKSCGTLSKISFCLCDKFQIMRKMLNEDGCSLKSNLSNQCLLSINEKASYYKSLSFYYQAKDYEGKSMVGHSIGLVRQAKEILEDEPTSILQSFSEDLLKELESFLRTLERDNEFIHHQQLVQPPSELPFTDLTQIKSFAEVVETLNIDFKGEHLFKQILPIEMLPIISELAEEKAKVLRLETYKNNVAEEELSDVTEKMSKISSGSFIAYQKQLLVKFQSLKDCFQSIISRASKNLETLSTLGNDMKAIDRLLENESIEYQARIQQYGKYWTQIPFSQANPELIRFQMELTTHLASLKSKLEIILLKCRPEEPNMNLLNIDNDSIQDFEKEARQVIERLTDLKVERERKLEELRIKIATEEVDINPRSSSKELITDELQKLDTICDSFEHFIGDHTDMISKFNQIYNKSEVELCKRKNTPGLIALEENYKDDEKISKELEAELQYTVYKCLFRGLSVCDTYIGVAMYQIYKVK